MHSSRVIVYSLPHQACWLFHDEICVFGWWSLLSKNSIWQAGHSSTGNCPSKENHGQVAPGRLPCLSPFPRSSGFGQPDCLESLPVEGHLSYSHPQALRFLDYLAISSSQGTVPGVNRRVYFSLKFCCNTIIMMVLVFDSSGKSRLKVRINHTNFTMIIDDLSMI